MGCRARMVGGPLHTEPFTIQSLQPGGQDQLGVVGRFEWLAKVKGRLKLVFRPHHIIRRFFTIPQQRNYRALIASFVNQRKYT